jgi:hypothetical protein
MQETDVKETAVRKGLVGAMLCAALGVSALPAHAGVLDGLFGGKKADDPRADKERHWQIDEFTAVRVVRKEAGAPANQHPAALNGGSLRAQLAGVEAVLRRGVEPLFDSAELDQLVPVLVKALALAGPDEDIQLVSTARRGGGALASPMAVTGRLFVHGDALQLIVHDTRLDFLMNSRMSRTAPRFDYGSRGRAGADTLRSPAGPGRRSDWVSFPMSNLTGPAVVGVTTAAPAPAARPVTPVAATVAPAAALPPAAAPAPPGSPVAIGEEIEQRLTTLKRLRDKGLITEEEYQQKRRELLQRL